MKFFIFSALIVVCLNLFIVNDCSGEPNLSFSILKKEWDLFKRTYNKTYGRREFLRRNTFFDNLNRIYKFNRRLEVRTPFFLGINKYADLNAFEIISTMNGFKKKLNSFNGTLHLPIRNVVLPKSFDWRKEGYVTNVKDQGLCASDWAFAAVGSMEGQLFRKNKQLVSLSEQNLIDCSSEYGNEGCEGGLMANSFFYIKENRGIDGDDLYSYEGKKNSCRYTNQRRNRIVVGYKYIEEGDEDALLEAVATVGPISVAINARHQSFHLYSNGIYEDEDCSQDYINHAVLVVGYGIDEETGKKYWLVKNSWGKSWGENGYMRIVRGKNMCGIATRASYPLL